MTEHWETSSPTNSVSREPGQLVGWVTERLRVRDPAGVKGDFSSPELSFCPDSYSVSVLLCVTVVACERPWSFCQKRRWQATPKHPCTLDPRKSNSKWVDYAVQAQSRSLSGKLAQSTQCSSGNTTKPQSSQLAEPLWTDPELKSGTGVLKLIST